MAGPVTVTFSAGAQGDWQIGRMVAVIGEGPAGAEIVGVRKPGDQSWANLAASRRRQQSALRDSRRTEAASSGFAAFGPTGGYIRCTYSNQKIGDLVEHGPG